MDKHGLSNSDLIELANDPVFQEIFASDPLLDQLESEAYDEQKEFFALKCNAIENVELAQVTCCRRRYVSVGAEGLKVNADGHLYEFPALPCIVRNVTGGGDALLAGIVHAGPGASVEESARWGLECARCAVESPKAVSEKIKEL